MSKPDPEIGFAKSGAELQGCVVGIQFPDVLLTFDKSGKLTQIVLSKIYTNHEHKATSDQNALHDFLKAKAGRKEILVLLKLPVMNDLQEMY